jgi:hypothetical protein
MEPRALLPSLTAAAIAAIVSSSCAIPSTNSADPSGNLPSQDSYLNNHVSDFMEARCGTLDCHGQDGRPLRIYSKNGLRLKNANGKRDTSATTDAEKTANYFAVIGLEPENMALCYSTQGASIDNFQLLKKPLDIVGGGIRHKGGPVLRNTDSDKGWQCLYGFAAGNVSKADCDDAAKIN